MSPGSPPQVRGKPPLSLFISDSVRITPAGAGKTSVSAVCEDLSKDHPRRCGENVLNLVPVCVGLGSPPQVRGKPDRHWETTRRQRITPAGAGKTASSTIDVTAQEDHPRRCGENSECRCRAVCGVGSPPQVRGKQLSVYLQTSAEGITPAGAGKTVTARTATADTRDHPRRCGENQTTDRGKGQFAGSPPQVRGKL